MKTSRKIIGLFTALFTLVCVPCLASAATWHVAADTAPGGDGTSLATAFDTIQAGIDAALEGDEVLIADGIYTGDGNRDISFDGKAITVRSENGPENCIVDCESMAPEIYRGFIFSDDETQSSVLDGLTIRNGSAPSVIIPPGIPYSYGGGIFCDAASPTVQNCILENNQASDAGGQPFGGGLCVKNGSPLIERCTFLSNESRHAGGGFAAISSSVTIKDCKFYQNVAWNAFGAEGGGLYVEDSTATITNCAFVANLARGVYSGDGGGLYFETDCSATMTNCTITRNESESCCTTCAGVCGSVNINLINCIVWDNRTHRVPSKTGRGSSPYIATYSCNDEGIAGEGNIYTAPLFVRNPDDGGDGWDDLSYTPEDESANNDYGDLRLQQGSPCLDAGNNYAVPADATTDLDGNPRFKDNIAEDTGLGTAPIVDMGAYENQTRTLLVNAEGTGDYATIQAAINAANDGDVVLCADGTYTGDGNRDISFNGKAITLMSENGPETCIIDCQTSNENPHRGFRFASGETEDSILDGFTITNGGAPEEDPEDIGVFSSHGGAVYLHEASPMIRNCRFVRCTTSPTQIGLPIAGGYGGGVSCNSSNAVFENCEFSNCNADKGGGLYVHDDNPVFNNCQFLANECRIYTLGMAFSRGAAIMVDSDTRPLLTYCKIIGNSVIGINSYGSSIYGEEFSTIEMANSVISGNAGPMNTMGNLKAMNTTFIDNRIGDFTTTKEIYAQGILALANCIVWGHPDNPDSPIAHHEDALLEIAYCNIQNGWFGEGNIDAQPLMVRLSDHGGDGWFDIPSTTWLDESENNDYGDFRLQPGSPCIDSGNSDFYNYFEPFGEVDLGGLPRFMDDPYTIDTGAGTPPIIDMGAYEYDPTNGDFDRDGDVDLQDIAGFLTCFGTDDQDCLTTFDFDSDQDIDLDDYMLFEQLM